MAFGSLATIDVSSYNPVLTEFQQSPFSSIPCDRFADLESANEIDSYADYDEEEVEDDGSYDSEDSQFETEPLDSSSTDDEPRSSSVSTPERELHRRRCRTPSVSDDSSGVGDVNSSDIPSWFYDGRFKYNGRVTVIALPGLAMVLLFSGEK